MKRFLIVEDQVLFRIGLEGTLRKMVAKSQIHCVDNFEDAVEVLSNNKVDLMILDLGIPGSPGSGMIQAFREMQKDLNILVCSGRDELSNAPMCISAGASGYLSKNASEEESFRAIEMVINKKKYASKVVEEKILNDFMHRKPQSTGIKEVLSPREREIMDLVLQGYSTKAIGSELRIKYSTVSTHKVRIFQKMNVKNVIDLFKKIESQFSGYLNN